MLTLSFFSRTGAVALVFALWISLPTAFAQPYPSDQERFTVNQIRGCTGLNIKVTANEDELQGNTANPIYKYNFDGDFSKVPVATDQKSPQDTTYNEPGTYTILQVVGEQIDSITIEVLEPRLPEVQVRTCINNSILVEINDEYYDRIEVNFGDNVSPPVMVATDQPSITHQYTTPGEYTVSVQGLFDNADSQNCARLDTTVTTINDLSVADLAAVTVESPTAVRVNYDLPNPNVTYRLEVAEAGSDNFEQFRYAATGEELVVDEAAFNTRTQSYCFRVVAVNACDESLNQVSDVLCSVALDGDVQNLQNQLSWSSEGFTDYTLTRDGTALLTATPDTEYLDTDVECQVTYEYQVTASSEQGTSTSELRPLVAESNESVPAPYPLAVSAAGQQLRIAWLPTLGATGYRIYRGVDEESISLYDSVGVADSAFARNLYFDRQVASGEDYCYQFTFIDACGNESALSESTCTSVPNQGQLHFPNAFTPNGDGLNDVFVYTSVLVEQVELQVYNRWGEVVFQTDQMDVGWDGRYAGGTAPQGTYLYRADALDELGNRFVQEGSFVLLSQ